MVFMNRLRELRETRNLRQLDVANATGIDQKPFQTMKPVKQTQIVMRL